MASSLSCTCRRNSLAIRKKSEKNDTYPLVWIDSTVLLKILLNRVFLNFVAINPVASKTFMQQGITTRS
jgi:hypothetical protein